MKMIHEPDERRFVAELEDARAVLEYRMADDRVLDMHRTFVPPALRGAGVGGELVRYALDHARAQGLRVVPSCPFVARVIREHPEYAELVADG